MPVYSLVGLTALVLGALVLHIWDADPRVPLYYANGGDNLFSYVFSKWFTDHWSIYSFNPRLAAPLGTNLGDWPQISTLHFAIQRVLGLVSGDGGVALNAYYLAFFPLSAVSAMFALRRFGLSSTAAFAPAVLFALLPYRFFRNEAHLYYASYWLVPLTVLACVIVARGNPVWRSSTGPLRVAPTKAGWFLVVAAVATGCDNQYHAFFATFFFLVAAALAAVRTRSWKSAAVGISLAALVFVTVAAQMLPTYVYHRMHGTNPAAYTRYPNEAQIYGLQVAQLLLPVPDHRISALAADRAFFDTHSVFNNENGSVTLGAEGSAGFLFLIGMLLYFGRRSFPPDLQTLTILNIFGVLFATVGGFGTFFNFFVRPEIRAYNRIAPFIGFFALAATAYAIAWVIRNRAATARRSVIWCAVAALTIVGAVEQTSHAEVPPHAASRALFASDETFGKAVDAALPSNAAVFELPVFPFPEGPPMGHILLSAEFRPYLHTRTTRWSFAAALGRAPATWDKEVGTLTDRKLVEALLLGGFEAVCIFRDAYADHGAAIETGLAAIAGPPRVVSPDGGMALYSLEPLYQAAKAADPRLGTHGLISDTVEERYVSWAEGFFPAEQGTGSTWHWAQGSATLIVDNEHPELTRVHFSALAQMGSRAGVLTVTTHNRVIARFPVGNAIRTPISFDFDAPQGQTPVTLSTEAPPLTAGDSRTFAIFNPAFNFPQPPASSAVERILAKPAPPAGTAKAVPSAVFSDVTLRLSTGCSGLEALGTRRWHWCGRRVQIDVSSLRAHRVRVSAIASTPGMPNAPLQVLINGHWRPARATPNGKQIDEVVSVEPGHPARMLLRTGAAALLVPGDRRDLVIRLDDLSAGAP
jgi:hypothetical protein